VIDTLREALAGERAWLVGGPCATACSGARRPTWTSSSKATCAARRAAWAAARAAPRSSSPTSSALGASWRRDRSWQVDITPLQGGSLEADLGARDLTVNAMAEPLAGGELVDPHGGAQDLDHKRLRMVSAEAFVADPLRTLRVARLATELGFEIDPDTAAAVRRHAPGLAEHGPGARLHRAAADRGSDAAIRGLELMDELELVAAVLPELAALHGVRAEPLPPPRRATATRSRSCRPRSTSSAIPRPRSATSRSPRRSARCWPSRWPTSSRAAARCASARSCTTSPSRRRAPSCPDGRVGFPGHDEQGAEMARAALARLRASERLRSHVAAADRAITCAWASWSTACRSIATSSTATC
jgi:tRNA nucleotidyltransferase/poly(A) polymerase